MCFYSDDDADWSASVVIDNSGRAEKECRCSECGDPIPAGAWFYSVFMQEHDGCQICEDEGSENYIDRKHMEEELADGDAEWAAAELSHLDGHACDFGETCSYARCETCEKVLLAIDEHERVAGCPPGNRQPSLFQLWDELAEHSDAPLYIREAVAVFPEIATHRAVGRYVEA